MQAFSRRHILRSAGGAALVGVTACAQPTAQAAPIKVANATGAMTQTMMALMQQQKTFESFGLKPEIIGVQDGSKILGAVISGAADVSLMSGFTQVFPAIEKGGGLKIIGGAALSPTTALVTGKDAIKTLKDLEGRSVGIGSLGALVHQLTVTLLRKYNVDVSKITFVNVGSSAAIFRAVSVGTVDAGAAELALKGAAERYKVRFLPNGEFAAELPEYTYQGAWTSDRAIQTKRDVIVRALAAQAKAYRFVQSPEAKDAWIAARKSVFPTQAATDHEADWEYMQGAKPFAVNLALDEARISYMQQLNMSFGIQKAELPYARVADMSLAADALKLVK